MTASVDVLRELEGLRALARSLVHGDAEADDLLQEAALVALEHPPETDRPVRPWFATVLRNRRRMDARAEARRRRREDEAAPPEASEAERVDEALDRARTLEMLASALVALEEPFRSTVLRRYLDGLSAADIARAAGVPAGTVRWRLKMGLERLRAALEAREPRWRRALVPLIPGVAVKTKSGTVAIAVVLLLLAVVGTWFFALRSSSDEAPKTAAVPSGAATHTPPVGPIAVAPPGAVPDDAAPAEPRPLLPGQARARIEILQLPGGAVSGHVINWSTGDGVANAELTFSGDGGATTVRSREGGLFELSPSAPGRYTLTAISAPGFLPYAPELLHSNVHVQLVRDRAVRGVTVFLFPALDYTGRVVDARKAPVAGAKVKLLGTPAGEQTIEKLATEWTTDKNGEFVFHAADFAVFEAVQGTSRGWAMLDGDVMNTKRLTIAIGPAPARDKTIAGKVVDAAGKPVADVLVRAEPDGAPGLPLPGPNPARATSFATSGPDGAFVLEGLDDGSYDLDAQAEGRAPTHKDNVASGTRGVALVVDPGQPIAGVVVTPEGDPVPAYTLLVQRRAGTARHLVSARSVVDASGRFEVRVEPGSTYELIATASGRAPSESIAAAPNERDVKLVVTGGATLRGTVRGDDGTPLGYARIMREARGGGASAQPANAGTVTRSDGTFELAGIPPGPVSITIGAGGYHPKIEAGMTATDGAQLGPIDIRLAKLKDGETPSLELVGIGVALAADADTLRVVKVMEGGGAANAGIVLDDRVIAVDGVAVAGLGVDGSVARIRGVAGTTVSVTLRRADKPVVVVCTRGKLRAGGNPEK